MSYDPKLAVRMKAFGLARSAKLNAVSPDDVEDLRAMAERELENSDPLFRAITNFATQFELHRDNREELIRMGAELDHAIDLANMPEPPDMNRSDIHG